MTELVTVDIGGTHARFALAEVADGNVLRLGSETVLQAADYPSFELAWEAFATTLGTRLPRAAAFAVASPITGGAIKLTNSPWVIRPVSFGERLGVDQFTLVNDFGAVAHAVAQAAPEEFRQLCGPDVGLPLVGTISVVGPGTGLGVSQVHRQENGYSVVECEGGHIDFAPVDSVDDLILAHLRAIHRRVSAERVVSGPGLNAIYEALARAGGRSSVPRDDKKLWSDALAGLDGLATAAFDRFSLSLGSVSGDLALAHGAAGVVIAGGLGLRISDHLPGSGFSERFAAKGRFETHMRGLPVKLLVHPQPGLLGAAAAFANQQLTGCIEARRGH